MESTKKRRGHTDWARVDKLRDTDIRKMVRSDPDAAPIVGADWFKRARLVEPKPKKAVSIRLDVDVRNWFKRRGHGYQTRMNAVLRAYVESQE